MSSKSPNPSRVGAHLICGGGRGRAPCRCAPGVSRSGWMSPPGTCPPGPDTLREGRGLVLGGGHSRAPPGAQIRLRRRSAPFSGILFKNKAQSLLQVVLSATKGTQPPSPAAPQRHHASGTATARPSPRKSSILEPRTQKTTKKPNRQRCVGKATRTLPWLLAAPGSAQRREPRQHGHGERPRTSPQSPGGPQPSPPGGTQRPTGLETSSVSPSRGGRCQVSAPAQPQGEP